MAEQIFEELDDQNLTKCRGISNTWYDATERIQWTRKIKKLTKENKNHQNSWKSVLVKIPTEFLKKFACTGYGISFHIFKKTCFLWFLPFFSQCGILGWILYGQHISILRGRVVWCEWFTTRHDLSSVIMRIFNQIYNRYFDYSYGLLICGIILYDLFTHGLPLEYL